MKRASIAPLVVAALVGSVLVATSNNVYQDLVGDGVAIQQDWADSALIFVSDDWSGVQGIVGYLGDDASGTVTNVDPRTLTADVAYAVDVNANRSDPNAFISGGVTEFEGPPGFDRVVALQGSGTADLPHLKLHVNATGYQNIRLTYNLRDIDGSADNAAQQMNAQYRVGTSGVWTNIDSTYVPDATTGSLATQVTPIAATLPANANGQKFVEVRIMTTNASGNDEWVGIDDIRVTGDPITDVPGAGSWALMGLAVLMLVSGGLFLQHRRSVRA